MRVKVNPHQSSVWVKGVSSRWPCFVVREQQRGPVAGTLWVPTATDLVKGRG